MAKRSFLSLFGTLSSDLAIDLGTANTLVLIKNKGIVINEPSVVAVQRNKRGEMVIRAIGKEAKSMLGKTPSSIEAIRPMRDGVIANFDITAEMIRQFIKKAQKMQPSLISIKPKVVIGIPSGITQVEKKAVREAAESAGAREVYLVEEPMAAATGAGLSINEAGASMVIDIGGGTTEVAVISLSGIVYSSSTRMGGDAMNEAVSKYVKKRYNLLIGESTAEKIKMEIGSAFPTSEKRTMDIKGRDLLTGIPKILTLNNDEILESLADVCERIVHSTKDALEHTPPELASDIVDRGIVLSGGGSLLKDLDVLLRERTSLPIIYADDPLSCVVKGMGILLNDAELLDHVSVT
ncbi:MAG: rod shape-determining protein [SAR324 cluster bacterium]|nr:rod shape-determining protein [SAR324 cluster bacterium]